MLFGSLKIRSFWRVGLKGRLCVEPDLRGTIEARIENEARIDRRSFASIGYALRDPFDWTLVSLNAV